MKYLSVLLILWASVASGKAIKVPIAFIEALDSKDTTSSERFRKEYETAIQYGVELTSEKLNKCGYEIAPTTSFYRASDPIQAKEYAEKADKAGSWMIVGPRRSNHYLLMAKGAAKTPSVSLMASSDKVGELGPAHLSLVPSDSVMAKAAAIEAAKRLKGKKKTFLSIVREDCLYCKGFAKGFDEAAQNVGLKNVGTVEILGNEPSMEPIVKEVSAKSPDIVLIPNYSIVTGYLISHLQTKFKDVIFVGGDGWGTSFGFVENGRDVGSAKGFTVRGNPPFDPGVQSFPTGKKFAALKSKTELSSASALTLLRVVDSISNFLCDMKPKSKEQFAGKFNKDGSSYFSAPWGVSIYDLSAGSIEYRKSVRSF